MVRNIISAAAIAAVVICPKAQADQYNEFQRVNFALSDSDTLIYTIFAPAFDKTRGTLNSVLFSLSGIATETVSYYQNIPPTMGTFLNTVQFNNGSPITLSTFPYNASSFTSPTTFGEIFGVVAQVSYPASYVQPTDQSTSLSFMVDGSPQPITCCAYTSVNFLGSLATVYNYTPVSEPLSLALLASPALAVGAVRRFGFRSR